MNPNKVEVGKRIRDIRISKDMTMEEFGNLIEQSPKSTVNNWEKGNTFPSQNRLKKISIVSGVSVEVIKYGTLENYVRNLIKEKHGEVSSSRENSIFELLDILSLKNISYNEDFIIIEEFEKIMTRENVEISLGDNIRIFRERNKMTQSEMAMKLNISRSYLGDLENNRRNPSIKTIRSIATALEVSLNDIIGEPYCEKDKYIKKLEQENKRLKEKILSIHNLIETE